MKKFIFIALVICCLLAGCGMQGQNAVGTEHERTEAVTEAPESSSGAEATAPAPPIYPLPDSTMDHLSDAILAVSLEEGNVFVDDTGKMQMTFTVYSYDKYDMVDIAMLKVGDTLVTYAGEVEITALERENNGNILINGGLYEDGVTLVTDENGVFYECGYNDAKNWYETGTATIRVSADFVCHDMSDLEAGEILYYPGSFLAGEVTDFHFTPYNTTIRVENGQIMEMHCAYTP